MFRYSTYLIQGRMRVQAPLAVEGNVGLILEGGAALVGTYGNDILIVFFRKNMIRKSYKSQVGTVMDSYLGTSSTGS